MNYIDENKVTTKQFFLNVFKFFSLLAKHWKILMISMLLGACVSLIQDLFVEKVLNFRASVIFKLEVEGGGSMGGLGGLANVMGMGGGGNITGGDLFSGQNFPAIVKSQKVLEKALMSTIKLDGKDVLLVNYVIDSSGITTDEWGGSLFRKPFEDAINHRFTKKAPEDFTELENLMMKDVTSKLQAATTIYPLEESTMVVISGLLTNEKLAKAWVDNLMKAVQEFYVEVKTQKTRKLLQVQERRRDSLAVILGSTDRRLSQLTFEQQNIVDPMGTMKQAQVNRKNQFVNQQYLMQLQTIEELNKLIFEQTPLFLIVEETRLPLEKGSVSTGLNLKLSSLAALLIMVIIVVVRWMYQEIMNTES
ncbi:hypothetical protein SAMN06298216_0451 [Spirosomataceae bacterium TFI 002]|nr:hypothetical protein SAMN06298216_0451 [Spirosomataceae bacterium TFI 002]